MFTSRDCVALVRPVSGEAELQKIDKIPYATLRPEFRTQMDKLKEKIFDEAQAKKIMGSSIDGRGNSNNYIDELITLTRIHNVDRKILGKHQQRRYSDYSFCLG
jgi:hypothetical protein